MPLSAFDKGKLTIAAHVREELDRAGVAFDDIRCNSGGVHTHPDIARLSVSVGGSTHHVDLGTREVEECESIVVGESWYKIAQFIERLR